MLDAACGSLVIANIDISVSNGVLSAAPKAVATPWATGMVAVAAGNNKIVRLNHKHAAYLRKSS